MRLFYTLLFTLSLPLILFRLSWRGFKAPLYWQRWSERFGNVTPHAGDNPVIWIHAVSVGETEATRPLVNALMQHYPNYTILITTMTPTGSERVKSLYGSTVEHCYLPYDVPFMVKRFFQRKAPKFGIIMETEIWPNLLYTANQLAIPLVLANARLSEKSADGYLRFEQFIKDTLANLTVIAAQSERDRQQFQRLGADIKKVHAIGNLKYEITLASGIQEQAALMRDMWNVNRPVFIAASTHEGEEEFILNAYRAIRAKHPDLLLILVPRHPERFDRVTALAQRAGFTTLRRSERKPCHSQIEVLMVDTMGELPLFYACSDVAFVGGSLMPVGGHNILEPAALGVPIISGPHVFNFSEITQQFIDANAMVMVQDTAALIEQVSRLLGFPTERDEMGKAAKTLIKSSQGASARLVNLINYNILQHEK